MSYKPLKTFQVFTYVRKENSFGWVDEPNHINMEVNIFGDENGVPHAYEMYEADSDDDYYYASGVLEVDFIDKKGYLTGYDGIFSLPEFIIDAVEEMGYDVEELR